MASNRYAIPAGRQRFEEEIRRSRFITTVAHTPTVEDARRFIAAQRTRYADASHNCWAYLIGPPGSTSQVGMSDDGEPHGTAGRPMLTVLEHADIGDIAVVVTRYFGGTLLGKGGLVKAYGGGVQYAIERMETVLRIPSATIVAIVPYNVVEPIRRILSDYETEALETAFDIDVTFTLKVPLERVDELVDTLVEMTRGEVVVEEVGREE